MLNTSGIKFLLIVFIPSFAGKGYDTCNLLRSSYSTLSKTRPFNGPYVEKKPT